MSSPFTGQAVIKEQHIHGFLGYFTVAAIVFTIGSTIALLLSQYDLASRSLSTRHGAQRKRLVQLFLGLALACFVVVTVLKYADHEARTEVKTTLAGDHPGVEGEELHARAVASNEEGKGIVQREVPWSGPGRQYVAVSVSALVSQILIEWTPFKFDTSLDASNVLAKWLPPFDRPADYWWSCEYYWGALMWFYLLSYETRVRALPWSAPVLLTLLSGYISLSGSQCLLYALMLMSPVRDTHMERWTPYQWPILVPLWLHAAAWSVLPSTSEWAGTPIVTFATGALTYAAFTAITWIHPRRLGKYHSTAVAAKRSRAVTFAIMALPLVAVRIYAASRTLLQAAAALNSKFAESVIHIEPEQAMEEAANDVKYAARSTFGMLGDTGRANAMAWDVVLSAVVVGLWLAFAEADPSTMLRSTLLPWLKDEDEVAYERHERTAASNKKSQSWIDAVKQLASVKNLTRFSRPDEGPTTGTAEAYVRKRGRPAAKHRKSASSNESGYAITRSKSKSRSPGRPRKSVSPSKQASVRTRSQSRARSQVRHGQYGWKHAKSLGISVLGWEAAGVAWCLVLLGGLGVGILAALGIEAAEFL